MNHRQIADLRGLEGLQVSLALADGTRIDEAILVSARVTRSDTLWLFMGGADFFVPVADVLEGWECRPACRFAA